MEIERLLGHRPGVTALAPVWPMTNTAKALGFVSQTLANELAAVGGVEKARHLALANAVHVG